jgi:RNA polymerase sigma factor (sigma-70 family)
MYTTRQTLLQKLRDSDDISWSEFYTLYWPFVFAIGTRLGMLPEDCKDLMQEIMLTLFNGQDIMHYDTSKGKFRTYFGQIVCHKALKMIQKAEKSSSAPVQESKDIFQSEAKIQSEFRDGSDPFRKIFDEEYHNYLLTLALNELRARVEPETYDIFEMVVLQNRPPKDVAKHLGLNRNIIDKYCSRCRKSLSMIISEIRAETPEFNPDLPI